MTVNNPAIDRPLILQCNVTTIRDINGRVDFVWFSLGELIICDVLINQNYNDLMSVTDNFTLNILVIL